MPISIAGVTRRFRLTVPLTTPVARRQTCLAETGVSAAEKVTQVSIEGEAPAYLPIKGGVLTVSGVLPMSGNAVRANPYMQTAVIAPIPTVGRMCREKPSSRRKASI